MEKKNLTAVSSTTEQVLQDRSTKTAPNNPSAIGYTAEQTKALFWKFVLDGNNSILGIIKKIITETNDSLNIIYTELEDKQYKTLDSIIYSSITTVEGTLAKLKEVIDTANTNIQTNATNITNIKGVGYSANQDYATLKAINDVLVSYKNFFTNLSDVDTEYDNILEIENKIKDNLASITTMQTNITNMQSDIVNNENNIATNTENIATNTSNISTIQSTISSNTENIATNTSNIANINSAITSIKGENYSSSQQYATLKALNDVLVSYKNFFTNLSNIDTAYDSLQELVTKIKALEVESTKWATFSNGIDNIDEALDTLTEISSSISTLQGNISDLQETMEDITTSGGEIPLATNTTSGLMPYSDKAKLSNISSGANKVEASTTNGNIKIDGVETNVYTNTIDSELSSSSTNAVQNKVIKEAIDNKANASNVYTKEECNTLLNNKVNANNVYTKEECNTLLADKINTNNVYSKTQCDTLLNNKANSSDVYSKTETDTLLEDKANSDNVYSKTESNSLLNNKANSNNVYTKTEIDNKLSSVYKYKGSVATLDNLPTSNLVIGDCYNVETNGINYAWNGTQWDPLGMLIDLSPYYTSSQVDNLLTGKVNTTDMPIVDTSLSSSSTNAVQNKVVKQELDKKLTKSDIGGTTATPNSSMLDMSNYTSGLYQFDLLESTCNGKCSIVVYWNGTSIIDTGASYTYTIITGDSEVPPTTTTYDITGNIYDYIFTLTMYDNSIIEAKYKRRKIYYTQQRTKLGYGAKTWHSEIDDTTISFGNATIEKITKIL